MGLFGGSKSSSSVQNTSVVRQQGVEGEDNIIISEKGQFIQEFPDSVAQFAGDLIGATQSIVDNTFETLESNNSAIAEIAAREKSPEQNLTPFVLIGAGAIVLIMIWGK